MSYIGHNPAGAPPEKAFVDFETASEANIKAMGSRRYLLHPSTDILMLSWWIRSETPRGQLWWPGEPFPERLRLHIERGGLLSGWKSIDFERIAWRHLCVPRHGFPDVPDEIWRDTMLKAAASNLPRSLDAAARSVGARIQKDKEGHALMLRITNKTRTPVIKPEELQRLGEYCIDDGGAEATTDDGITEWPAVWPWSRIPDVDRQINDRGVLLDVELVRGLAAAADTELLRLDDEMKAVTGDRTIKTSSVEKIKDWLIQQGVTLPTDKPEAEDGDKNLEEDGDVDALKASKLRKSDIADILAEIDGIAKRRNVIPVAISADLQNSPDRLAAVQRVLEMRAEAAKASTKKLKAALNYMDPDGRVRQCLILGGAQATLRWSSTGPQFHNLPRVVIPNDKKDGWHLEGAIRDGRTGDAGYIRSLWGDVLPFAAKMLRRCLCAPQGKTLLQGDFAQVEARITAWLAGQQNIVDAFARGDDVYKIAAAPIFKLPIEALTKEQRQIGKVSVLALGYAGGGKAFAAMAANYMMKISEQESGPIVKAWRASNTAITGFWRDCEAAILAAVLNPGYEYRVGDYPQAAGEAPNPKLVSYFVLNDCLHARLPSGRFLRYWAPRVQDAYWPDGNYRGKEVTFLKVKGSAVFRAKLYGGLATENLAQAIAADLLAGALVRLSDAGFEIVLHVHDSIAAEIAEEKAEARLHEFESLMKQPELWATGLPVGADCHIGNRFG